jgi:transglutaminase-like putative cysteine protease
VIFAPAPAAPLTRAQLTWLGALVVLAQLPLWAYLPPWAAATGSGLTAARLLLPADRTPPPWLRHWLLPLLALVIALGIRWQYGYFVARDPFVAFLYALVAIKYIEARTPRDGGLLVCLALFLTLTQFFYAQTIAAALVVLPAVLVLGGALAALRSAPSLKTGWKAPLLATGRMLAQGIPLAALLFILFPRLVGPLWGTPSNASAHSGLSDRMSPGSISELSLSDNVAFRVDFITSPPPRAQRYWRGPVLSRFDGLEWSAHPRLGLAEFATTGPRTVDYTVALEPNNRPWLFALEQAAAPPRPIIDDALLSSGLPRPLAVLSNDHQLITRAPVTQPLRYTQRSTLVDRFPAGGGAEIRDNLQLPARNPRTVAFARDLRSRSPSDRAFIASVLAWFSNEAFVYTLAPPLLEGDTVDDFLFDTRRGFCEHYAGAFVVLLRAAGIPARVVTGYQGGEINPTGDYMIVRDSDAHAWAEALLDGQWQRFDPTAAVAPWRIERGLGALPQGEPVPYLARLDMTWLKNLRLHWDAVNYQWQRGIVGFNIERQHDLWRQLGLEGVRGWLMVSLAAAMVVVWGVAFLGLGHWLVRRRDPVVALWARLCRRLARAGLPRRAEEGPLAYAQRAAARWPQWSELLQRIAATYALLRYGPDDGTRSERVLALRAGVASLPQVRALRGAAHSR